MIHCTKCKGLISAKVWEIGDQEMHTITLQSEKHNQCEKCYHGTSQSSQENKKRTRTAKTGEERKMVKQTEFDKYEFKEAEAGEVFPMQNAGDNIIGKIIGIRKGTYGNVYDLETADGVKTVFGSTVIDGKITADKMDSVVRIEFLGMETGIKSGREYKNFKISFGTPKE